MSTRRVEKLETGLEHLSKKSWSEESDALSVFRNLSAEFLSLCIIVCEYCVT